MLINSLYLSNVKVWGEFIACLVKVPHVIDEDTKAEKEKLDTCGLRVTGF